MGSPRAQKDQQRAQRQAKRQARRARHAAKEAKKTAQRDPRIGYVAYEGVDMACDGDACIVAGSYQKMRDIAERFGDRFARQCKIQVTGFEHIYTCLRLGAAYCFDEEAYGRFLQPAQRRGMPLKEEDFSDPGPHGLHFVRVQWFG
jgi:hypothetical protein